MVEVEILGSDGWKTAGDYRLDRAAQLATLLRSEGAIVRVEGERPKRPRMNWQLEAGSASLIGRVDGIDLFIAVFSDRMVTLLTTLPGYDRDPKYCTDRADAQDTAERLLDKFIMRLGVHGLATPRPTSQDTLPMETLP